MLTPHLHQLRAGIEFGNPEAIKRAAAGGLGISCLSRYVVEDFLRAGQLVAPRTQLPRLARRFYLVMHERKQRTRGLERLIDYLQRWMPRRGRLGGRDSGAQLNRCREQLRTVGARTDQQLDLRPVRTPAAGPGRGRRARSPATTDGRCRLRQAASATRAKPLSSSSGRATLAILIVGKQEHGLLDRLRTFVADIDFNLDHIGLGSHSPASHAGWRACSDRT